MFSKLAIWYLRKRGVSVMLGYKIKNAEIQPIHSDSNIFGNIFADCEFRTQDGQKFDMLHQITFTIKGKSK